MGFLQHCFIRKNTPELRKFLRSIGYHQNIFDANDQEWLACNYGMFISVSEGFERVNPNDIDCGTNEALFMALAALNNANDYKQWFIDESTASKTWYLSDLHRIGECFQNTKSCRKATAEEIINHFSTDGYKYSNKHYQTTGKKAS